MPDNTPVYPPERYDEVRPGTDTASEVEKKKMLKHEAPEKHMGAEEGDVVPSKPPLDELASLMDDEGHQGDEHSGPNPKDEITSG